MASLDTSPNRNGVYYLAAVLTACLLGEAIFWGASDFSSGSLLRAVLSFLYLFPVSVLVGWLTAVLFAFVLRRTATALRLVDGWQWSFAGAVFAPALVASIYVLFRALERPVNSIPQPIVQFIIAPLGLFVGAIALGEFVVQSIAALVVMSTAGAVTALVLQRVHRRRRQKAPAPFTASPRRS